MENQTKPHVLVLGTYHMANNNLDVFNVQADDVLQPKRQAEIREVVDCLKKFQPTKVAVEVDISKSDNLTRDYKNYLLGDFELSQNEIHQIGFRIAQESNHDGIYAVDWRQRNSYIGMGHVLEYAQEHHKDLYKRLMSEGEEDLANNQSELDKRTVRELLSQYNSPEFSRNNHQFYMDLARIGEGDYYIGIEWVIKSWYHRNMIIYTNVSRLAASKDDRILVMFGAGHNYLLNQFFNESNSFHVDKVEDYLG